MGYAFHGRRAPKGELGLAVTPVYAHLISNGIYTRESNTTNGVATVMDFEGFGKMEASAKAGDVLKIMALWDISRGRAAPADVSWKNFQYSANRFVSCLLFENPELWVRSFSKVPVSEFENIFKKLESCSVHNWKAARDAIGVLGRFEGSSAEMAFASKVQQRLSESLRDQMDHKIDD